MDKSIVLIVDDNPANLGVFFEYLEESGFEISVAKNGESAIKQLDHFQPDIILLDVMMPGMDGFETCRHLKQNETTQDIPVVFMTALDDSVNKVKGFLAGGADYITKPLHHEEALVRITAHLTVRKLQQQIEAQNTTLTEKNEIIEEQKVLLEQQDEQLKKLDAYKARLFSFVSNDLQVPLNKLLGFIRVISENINDYSKEELTANIERLQHSAEELYASHENLLTWSALQQNKLECSPESVDVQEIAVYHILAFTPQAEKKKITLNSTVQEKMLVYADYTMVNTIVQNLISNALKFTDNAGSINIAAKQTEDGVEISVSDTGVGIKKEELPRLFQVEAIPQKNNFTNGTKAGLGLILCKELVEKNGGKIWCESEAGEGTTFTFTLPTSNGKQ